MTLQLRKKNFFRTFFSDGIKLEAGGTAINNEPFFAASLGEPWVVL